MFRFLVPSQQKPFQMPHPQVSLAQIAKEVGSKTVSWNLIILLLISELLLGERKALHFGLRDPRKRPNRHRGEKMILLRPEKEGQHYYITTTTIVPNSQSSNDQ